MNAAEPRPPRLTLGAFLASVGDEVFSLERGFPWTFWQLARRPGWAVRRYVEWRDPRLTRPLRYLIVAVALAAVLLHALGVDRSFMAGVELGAQGSGADAARAAAIAAVFARFDLILLLVWVPAVALAVRLAYRRHDINLIEAIVLAAFVLAQVCLLQALLILVLVHAQTGVAAAGLLAMAWPFVYLAWTCKGYFADRNCGIGAALGATVWAFILMWVLLMLVTILAVVVQLLRTASA
ncbi:MAG TPA: DUF3667 domain-containing protein [Xanthomonadaceae bacterium]|nr:DUF3667 domain-containing protein [Xanthomonadaceae bacterium]